jgi:large subunit ribosomal protein L5
MAVVGLKEKYLKEVLPAMKQRFNYKNNMAVPRIDSVIVNIGFGKRVSGKTSNERKKVEQMVSQNLAVITAQKPILTRAGKSIAGFRVRRGMVVGAKVTLRGQKMYDFLDRLIHIALPRSRDFRGIDLKSIDQQGNLTIGIKEHIIFPEVTTEKVQDILGFEITVKTTAKNKEQGIELLRLLGFPLKK